MEDIVYRHGGLMFNLTPLRRNRITTMFSKSGPTEEETQARVAAKHLGEDSESPPDVDSETSPRLWGAHSVGPQKVVQCRIADDSPNLSEKTADC